MIVILYHLDISTCKYQKNKKELSELCLYYNKFINASFIFRKKLCDKLYYKECLTNKIQIFRLVISLTPW